MKRLAGLKGLLVLILSLVLFTGCGAEKEKPVENKPLETVDVILDWYPNALYSFIYVAMEKGYFLVLFTGCGAEKEKPVENKPLETVDVILDWYPNALYSFIYVAMEKGYFEEEGRCYS